MDAISSKLKRRETIWFVISTLFKTLVCAIFTTAEQSGKHSPATTFLRHAPRNKFKITLFLSYSGRFSHFKHWIHFLCSTVCKICINQICRSFHTVCQVFLNFNWSLFQHSVYMFICIFNSVDENSIEQDLSITILSNAEYSHCTSHKSTSIYTTFLSLLQVCVVEHRVFVKEGRLRMTAVVIRQPTTGCIQILRSLPVFLHQRMYPVMLSKLHYSLK